MMITDVLRNAKIPAAAFTAVALFIGLALLALQVTVQMELMAPELQYFCTEDQSTFCFINLEQASAISRAPLAFLVSLALVPAFLAVLLMRLQKTMPTQLRIWVVAAMWLAFALYLAVPFASLNFASPSSGTVAQNEWTLYPPLSAPSTSYQIEAILNSLQINIAVVTILLILNLFCFTIAGFTQLRSTPSKVVRLGFATLMILVIWVFIMQLTGFLKMISIDRNFGTVFFDPVSQPVNDYPIRLLEHLDSLGIWYALSALCCVALWFLAKRS